MSLPWVRLDAGFWSNPKVIALVDDKQHQALNLYVFALAYSGQHGLDGYIPTRALRLLHSTTRHADHLVKAGLWHPNGEGWWINDWDEFQQSNTETKARRENLAGQSRKANCIRWHGPDCGCWRDALIPG